ncbi:HNH endonuclease [Aeromonas simiae]|uniref:HNH endonuclease n=1 Tax=Aeromonas simiae TaxID=218936 RepID=UPI0038D10AD2
MPVPHRRDIKAQLVALLSSNGPITTKKVYAAFVISWELSSSEIEKKRDGRALYENEIRWARQELVQEGIIEKPEISGRAIWKLKDGVFIFPEECDEEPLTPLTEGVIKKISVNAYERSKKARDKCLEVYGYVCAVCEFDFESTYGTIGKNCIHVHHLIEISSIGKEYVVNPVKDMVPVCPNCHYIIHRRKPAFSIHEVKAMLKSNKSFQAKP